MVSETDPLNNTTTYAYDAFGNKVSETLPTLPNGTTSVEIWTYNALQQLVTSTDFDGHVITYAYDDQGRVVEKDEYVNTSAAQCQRSREIDPFPIV